MVLTLVFWCKDLVLIALSIEFPIISDGAVSADTRETLAYCCIEAAVWLSLDLGVKIGAVAVSACELVPVTRELVPVTRELVPVTRELVPVTREFVPVTGELAPETRDLVPVTMEASWWSLSKLKSVCAVVVLLSCCKAVLQWFLRRSSNSSLNAQFSSRNSSKFSRALDCLCMVSEIAVNISSRSFILDGKVRHWSHVYILLP